MDDGTLVPRAPAGKATPATTAACRGAIDELHREFKDCVIEVRRDEFDDEAWQTFVDRAHTPHEQREAA